MNMNKKRIEFQALNGAYRQRGEHGSEGATRRVVKLLRVLIPAVCISIMLIGCGDDAGNSNTGNGNGAAAGVYACTNGATTRADKPDGSADVQACNTCTTGYKLMGTANAPNSTCVAAVYTCINGATTRTDKPSGNTDAQACTTCTTGYELMGTANAPNSTCVAADTPPTVTGIRISTSIATSVTITVNINKTGKLFWVAYADGATPAATPAALISVASQMPSGMALATSGSDGLPVAAVGTQTVVISGLTVSTNYDVYFVAQDAAGNASSITIRLDIATVPVFTLHTNTVTVLCPKATIGETGIVGGTTYTKRATGINAANAATTCTSGITSMSSLFANQGTFNADIGSWDVSSVTNIGGIFSNANTFNHNIGSWDVSSVTNMNEVFNGAHAFNQNIDSWDVSNVTTMEFMFSSAINFNQNLSGWCVLLVSTKPTAFSSSAPLTGAHTPVWGSCPAR